MTKVTFHIPSFERLRPVFWNAKHGRISILRHFEYREEKDRSKSVAQDHSLANAPLGYFIRATRS